MAETGVKKESTAPKTPAAKFWLARKGVRHFSDSSFPVRNCVLSRETYCSSKVHISLPRTCLLPIFSLYDGSADSEMY